MVDDNKIIRTSFCKILRKVLDGSKIDYNIITAEDGIDTLRLVKLDQIQNKIKYNLKDKCLIPDNYLLYPPLIVGTHRELKASSIFDSLCQSIESLISLKSNKISQKNSLNSISLILKNYKNFLRKNLIFMK